MLVAPAESYRLADFVAAAAGLRLDVVVASDATAPIAQVGRARRVLVDFLRPEWSAARIARLRPTPQAVVAVDDRGVGIAARAAAELGLAHNPLDAVAATCDKVLLRRRLEAAGVPQPRFAVAPPGTVAAVAGRLGYPCVVKPAMLAASRGVLRVDDPAQAAAAEARIRRVVRAAGADPDRPLVVEEYVPGAEVVLEGLVVHGELEILAVLDKPDPMEGPTFPETLLVTPSRHPAAVRAALADVTRRAVAALGLVAGPIHAELRVGPEGPVLIEVAARPIGGLCGRSLLFGLLAETLESVILRGALGLPGADHRPARRASGVLMLPVPAAGRLAGFAGVAAALAVRGITAFEPTIPTGRPLVPLPEGDRYLAFLFAEGPDPAAVETALREAWRRITVRVEPAGDLPPRC